MKRAILLTGFNNWGKTTHIYKMFGQGRFYKNGSYSIVGVNTEFTVESHSNDDFDENGFVNTISEKMRLAPDTAQDLFCAFCPSREPKNDSLRILRSAPFAAFDEIHVLLLLHKWDFHAELRIADIKRHFSPLTNIKYLVVDDDTSRRTDKLRAEARESQILAYLAKLYP